MKALNTNTKLQALNKALSSLGGLHTIEHLMQTLGMQRVEAFLPTQKIRSKTSPYEKFRALVLGFIAGAECLDRRGAFAALEIERLWARTSYPR